MTILPCLFSGFEHFHPLQFPRKVSRVTNTAVSVGSPAKLG
jgi:hypothetical protein